MTKQQETILVVATTYPVSTRPDIAIPEFVADLCAALATEQRIVVVVPHVAGAKTVERHGSVLIVRFRYAPQSLETLAYCSGGMLAAVRRYPWRLVWMPAFLLAMAGLTRKLAIRYRAKIIHSHWLFPAALASRWTFVRYPDGEKPAHFVTSHGGDLHSLSRPGVRGILRRLIRKSTGFAVVSPALAQKCINDQLTTVAPTVIPMGVDLQHIFTPNPNVKKEPNELLFAGRLVRKKGGRVLLSAIAQLAARNIRPKLRIVGDGPERPLLERQVQQLRIASQVEFLGWQPKHRLPDYFRSATAAIVPSTTGDLGDREGLGLVAVEAMGCECPLIIADYPEIQELIVDGQNGVLFHEGDASELASAIERLLSDNALREAIGKAARQSVLQRYDWMVVAAKHRKWFGADGRVC